MWSSHEHELSYHEHDHELVELVARFVADGLALGERVAVVATPTHRHDIAETLELQGVDLARARAQGHLLELDAEQTLAELRPDGELDRARFFDQATHFVADGDRVRVFGEMVALLWQAGDVAGALELETLWNEFLAERRVRILCAYPSSVLSAADLGDVGQVVARHTGLHGTITHRTQAEGAAVFLPVADSVPAVRRFVASLLAGWDEMPRIVADAALVASELATNAVLHAGSPFRLTVSRTDGVIRLAFQDVEPDPVRPRAAEPEDTNGRGMVIVAALSRRWGSDPLPNGKVVWAELGPDTEI